MIQKSDRVKSRIPQHIREAHPNFVAFLSSYYEWLQSPGSPYYAVRNHMDFLNFEKSLDSYVDYMMEEYVTNIPKNVAADKKQFIEWSRKFNLARGSHESIKFLFKVLFNESTTDIYLPKDNILRSSDGTWIQDQSVMLCTNPGIGRSLLYKTLRQVVEPSPGVFVEATAIVENQTVRYSGGFNVLELVLTDIKGEFLPDVRIDVDEETFSVWPLRTVVDFEIEDGGSNYFPNELLKFDAFDQTYTEDIRVRTEGEIDTRITTLLTPDQIQIFIGNDEITGFEYDGRYVKSELFTLGATVKFIIPQVFVGTMKIGTVDENGSVLTITVEDPPIGLTLDVLALSYDLVPTLIYQSDYVEQPEYGELYTNNFKDQRFKNRHVDVYESYSYSDGYTFVTSDPPTTSIGLGDGLQAFARTGIIRKIPGYYQDTKGHLSSNMYLIDSDYYQEYSYVIKTEQDISKYATILKEVLHPAGFKFFGNVEIVTKLELLLGVDDSINIQNIILSDLNKYSSFSNYQWISKAGYLSPRVYKGDEFDFNYVLGEDGYELEDDHLERTFDELGHPLIINKKGWMSYNSFQDYDIRQPQDYFEEDVFDGLYVESSYILTPNIDEQSFLQTYINTFTVFDYTDTDYTE